MFLSSKYKEDRTIKPREDVFSNFIHEKVNLQVNKHCNDSPRAPSWSVGKLEFYCDRNSYYNMLYDFDPNRPYYFRGGKKNYGNIFAGRSIHEKIAILPFQEVYMEFEGIGGHFDDLSSCGTWLIDKKTLDNVENWTNYYIPRESHCRQVTFYRVLAHYGTLKEDVLDINGEVAYCNGIKLEVGVKPKFNIKKAHIVYMPMNNVNDVRVTEPDRQWLDIPVQGAASMLLGKKDRVEEAMLSGVPPSRAISFECDYCHWYDTCFNTGDDYDKDVPEHIKAKLETSLTLGGGGG